MSEAANISVPEFLVRPVFNVSFKGANGGSAAVFARMPSCSTIASRSRNNQQERPKKKGHGNTGSVAQAGKKQFSNTSHPCLRFVLGSGGLRLSLGFVAFRFREGTGSDNSSGSFSELFSINLSLRDVKLGVTLLQSRHGEVSCTRADADLTFRVGSSPGF